MTIVRFSVGASEQSPVTMTQVEGTADVLVCVDVDMSQAEAARADGGGQLHVRDVVIGALRRVLHQVADQGKGLTP